MAPPPQVVVQRVLAAVKSRLADTDDSRQELLYVTATLFLHALHDYACSIDKGESLNVF